MKSLYLLVNFFTIIIPFLFSFHPKIRFHKTWKAFFPAAIIVAIVFALWDAVFTRLGVWNFNPDYVLGSHFLGLPVEEWLFFICIPYSCVFTYFCLVRFYNLKWRQKPEVLYCIIFSVALIIIAILFYDRIYTFVTFISTAIVCLYLKFIAKVDWFGEATTVYAILLIPFFIVNGVLTGTGIDGAVVRYNPDDFMGIRILTIPVEDAVYGYELILLNIYLYKIFLRRFWIETQPSKV